MYCCQLSEAELWYLRMIPAELHWLRWLNDINLSCNRHKVSVLRTQVVGYVRAYLFSAFTVVAATADKTVDIISSGSVAVAQTKLGTGEILVDGINIKEYSINSLRQLMGIVTQEPILFNDTIAANIALGKPDAAKEEIEKFMRGSRTFIGHYIGGCAVCKEMR